MGLKQSGDIATSIIEYIVDQNKDAYIKKIKERKMEEIGVWNIACVRNTTVCDKHYSVVWTSKIMVIE